MADNETSLIQQPHNLTVFSFPVECWIREVLLYMVRMHRNNVSISKRTSLKNLNVLRVNFKCTSSQLRMYFELISNILQANFLCTYIEPTQKVLRASFDFKFQDNIGRTYVLWDYHLRSNLEIITWFVRCCSQFH